MVCSISSRNVAASAISRPLGDFAKVVHPALRLAAASIAFVEFGAAFGVPRRPLAVDGAGRLPADTELCSVKADAD